jgi:hypothetical protein
MDMNCEQNVMDARELNDAELDAISGGLSDRAVGILFLAGGPLVWAVAGAAWSVGLATGHTIGDGT